jgi:hypothetical protein
LEESGLGEKDTKGDKQALGYPEIMFFGNSFLP